MSAGRGHEIVFCFRDVGGDKVKAALDSVNQGGASASSITEAARAAKVVKAFNTIGAEHLENPVFGGERAAMFICGDDDAAKRIVGGLAEDLGFEVVDAGRSGQGGCFPPAATMSQSKS